MQSLADFLYWLDDLIWGIPMIVILVGTGMYLSIRFRFIYQRRIAFHFKNTYGKMFKKAEGEGTVSGFAAACTALANTIGTGNISGVATAIVSGGPGALVWMWFSSFFGMSIKACEIIIGQRYRQKYENSMDEYVCDRSFVMKNAFGWNKGAIILAVFCLVFGPWTCCVQTEAVTSSIREGFGIAPWITVIVIGITCFLTIVGGLRRISGFMEKIIPVMAVLYVIAGLGIIILNITKVPEVVILIFKSAFTPTAAVGGFAGATVRQAIQYGVARGLYSNDAGTGYGIIAHASAKTDHPVRQSSWGWGEIFLDTIVICSITAFTILSTNSYISSDATSGALTTIAFKAAYGSFGGMAISLAIAIFAWTTIIGMYYACEKSVNYALGDTKINKIAMPFYMIYYLIPCLLFYNIKADILWAFTDILTAAYVIITLVFIYGKRREIFRLFDDFWNLFIPAQKRGENPPPVMFHAGKEK
jgi:AGCS family alanine or glycine:cation symporter